MKSASREAWESARPQQPPFDTACIAPWVSLEFDPAGWVYACCTSQLYPLGRIGDERLSELWNGPRAQVLKDALRRWDMSVACQPCRFHLEHRRMDPAAAVYDQYPLDGPEPDAPHMMLFALSNRCNLGCIMCSPALSSRLQLEAGLPAQHSPYDDEFFEDLEPLLHRLELAKFLGGEPFLSPEHRRVWSMLDQLDTPPKLSVTTNGTIWTDNVDWLTDRFEVDISVSIDAVTRETYSAVRGGDLSVVHRNMERFSARCQERGTNLHVSFCLMPQNAHELGRFLVWAEPYTFGAPAYVNLVSDEGMALHDLPTPALEQIRRRWEAEDAEISARLDRNAGAWRTQLDQIDDALEARRSGNGPSATRARPAPPSALSVPCSKGPPRPHGWFGRVARRRRLEAELDAERARLFAWGTGSTVADLRCDGRGIVTDVVVEHERLGLVRQALVGGPVESIVAMMSAADGRPVYLLDQDEIGAGIVRTLILCDESPVRGSAGTVVRVVQLETRSGWACLIAEDRTYDTDRELTWNGAGPATPVQLTSRPK